MTPVTLHALKIGSNHEFEHDLSLCPLNKKRYLSENRMINAAWVERMISVNQYLITTFHFSGNV
jgi:hypothetical protein